MQSSQLVQGVVVKEVGSEVVLDGQCTADFDQVLLLEKNLAMYSLRDLIHTQ